VNNLPPTSLEFEFAPCGLVTTEINGTIRRVNSTFCNWLGVDADELIDKRKIQELLTVGGRFFHQTHLSPLLQLQGSVAEVQIDLRCSDGSSLPTLINVVRREHEGNYFDQLAFFVATDRKKFEKELISTRKSAEHSLASLQITQEKLQESRNFLSIAMRSARMGVWTKNLETKQELWNSELKQLAGLTEIKDSEPVKNFVDYIHPDDINNFETQVQTAITSGSDYYVLFRFQHASENWLTLECRGRATYFENGDLSAILGVVIDISDRKAAENKVHELNQQLSIADRRKDEFLATLAHELRNPLAPIKNVLEIMRHKESNDSSLQWAWEMIERHVVQMTHLVDDLMETSRISQGRMELRRKSVDIVQLAQDAIDSSWSVIRNANHTFSIKKPETPLVIEADPTRIIQIISNLLTNAAKYTPDGGKICLNIFRENDEVVLSVLDSGMGIPQEQLSNIFGMFSQLTPALERSQGGLGIGLALVHGLVHLHGGTIVALSEGPGKGCEFIVRLPIIEAITETLPIIEKSDEKLFSSKRVLVIDDNEDAADSLASLLEYSGHVSCKAYDGISGLESAEKFNPDVILLDIGLPDINGYEVARRIRQQTWGENLFLIAATGWGQDSDKESAKKAGCDRHLTKPIDFQELKSLLQTYVQ